MKTTTYYLSLGWALILLIGMSLTGFAQVYMGLGMHRALPQNEFDEEGYRQGMGSSVNFLSSDQKMGPLAFQFGGQFDYTSGTKHKMDIVLLEPANADATMKVNNESLGMYGVARLISPEWGVRLYADGMLGTRYLTSKEEINLKGAYPGYEDETSDVVLKSWTLSYGAAVGLQFALTEGIALDLRGTWLKGGNADYVDLSTVNNVKDSRVNYDVVRSPTDMIQVHVGFNFRLDDMGCAPSRCQMPHDTPESSYLLPPLPPTDCPNPQGNLKPAVAPTPVPTPRTPAVQPAPRVRPAVNTPRRTSGLKP